MAVNTIEIAAPPETVFDVLADPALYGYWVVGARVIRGADDGFPAPGTRLHHTVGVGPLSLRDHSTVVESERPKRLVLDANLGPIGSALVTLDLIENDGGTRVVMTERASRGIPARLAQRVGDALLRGRNTVSLERLKELAEGRARG
ncbi:MAG TPA: SRPBCC domain-containing protein [Gaiellaceae bacterium]|nr:SRPBCC domain-containing protein [Gaiellaceae bacterium]